jgi:hypothetical protein
VDDATARRIGHNEAKFRYVNEMLAESKALVDANQLYPYRCECGSLGCNQLIELTMPEYQSVRKHATHFILVDGHQIPEAEHLVERHQRFIVVAKDDTAAEVARATDPRE